MSISPKLADLPTTACGTAPMPVPIPKSLTVSDLPGAVP
jgi:hypothetical protein